MNKLSRIVVAVAVLGVVFAVTVAPTASAQSSVMAPRCTIAEPRLKTLVTTVGDLKEMRQATLSSVQTKVEAIIKTSKDAGYDVTKLTTANSNLKSLISNYETTSAQYGVALTATQTAACGEVESTYTSALTDARTKLAATRTANATARALIQTEIIPELQAYVLWLKVQASEARS